jgi:hypothetical protein
MMFLENFKYSSSLKKRRFFGSVWKISKQFKTTISLKRDACIIACKGEL